MEYAKSNREAPAGCAKEAGDDDGNISIDGDSVESVCDGDNAVASAVWEELAANGGVVSAALEKVRLPFLGPVIGI